MVEAVIVVKLVPEATSKSKQHIENEIAKTLQCDWLLKVKKVTISEAPHYCLHHRMPNGKEVRTHG
jgi:hypothetical protein